MKEKEWGYLAIVSPVGVALGQYMVELTVAEGRPLVSVGGLRFHTFGWFYFLLPFAFFSVCSCQLYTEQYKLFMDPAVANSKDKPSPYGRYLGAMKNA